MSCKLETNEGTIFPFGYQITKSKIFLNKIKFHLTNKILRFLY